MTPEDKSKIEELKKSLYSRNAPEIRAKRRFHFTKPETTDVQTDWVHPAEPSDGTELTKSYKDHSMSFLTKIFIGSIIFFVLALTIGALLIFKGENIISANNIAININGPITVAGGDPITFDVQVVNKNNVKLQAVDLLVEFPAGTVDPNERLKEMKQFRELMNDISPGGMSQKRVSAVLYGEENTKKEIRVNISYKVSGSNAVFKKQKVYEILISSSPLSLSIDTFQEVTSGQEFETEVTIVSNSAEIIKNLLLRVEYPFGYTLTSSEARAEGNKSIWKIGDIPPNGKKTIRFSGRLEGQDGEARVFRFTIGAQSLQKPGVISTEYIAASKEVTIEKPFMSTGIAFENDSATGEYTSAFNNSIRVTLSWFNNLPTAVTDGELRLKLSGTAFDKASVNPGEGHYKSADNEIVWSKLTTPALRSIGAGENGSVTFTFTPRNFSTPTRQVANPGVILDLGVEGRRVSESNVPETVVTSSRRMVKISSDLSLSPQITRSTGPFSNTGPIPPQAEKQTTYTVTWTVDNTVNTVTGAEVRALLPVYVKWLGKVSPTGEDVSYNRNNGEVVWRVGNVDAFTTTSGKRRHVAFQIGFEPSVSQVGQIPLVVQDTTLTGLDDFTGATLTITKPALTTRFASDPAFKDGQDAVAQ